MGSGGFEYPRWKDDGFPGAREVFNTDRGTSNRD